MNGHKVIELGGGANPTYRPNVDVRQCFDAAGNPTVEFTADFNEPLPIQSGEWDGVYCRYVVEHLSWRKVRGFLAEVLRILKPGGTALFVTANVRKQIEWIAANPDGWDGRDAFDSFSCVLFGDQDYPENAHRNWMDPDVAARLFRDAGFGSVTISPVGDRGTDMAIEAVKPFATVAEAETSVQPGERIVGIEVASGVGVGVVVESTADDMQCESINPTTKVRCVREKGHAGDHRSLKPA